MKKLLTIGAVLLGSGVLLAAGYLWWDHNRYYVSTEDATVAGRPHPVTVRIPGTVVDVLVHDNEPVRKGQVLFRLDPGDYQTRLMSDEGSLDVAKKRVDVDQSRIQEVEAEEERIQSDLKRISRLRKGGYSSTQSLIHLRLALKGAKARIQSLENQIRADQGMIERRTGQVAEDHLNLSYTTVVSPVDGKMTVKSVVRGLYVSPGTPLGYVVPYHVWVIANLKESRLTYVRPGDPVDIRVDAYPGRHFHGHVASIQQTTGAVMSLLPPENATGNFTKVVQRVPVRIALDPGTDPHNLLRLGLSVVPVIRVNPNDPPFRPSGNSGSDGRAKRD
ncbi:MAG: HlyD family secretion protein [Nitrospirae bacterium]|nr:HlyD family secretion protein [Nitrospirota bacterium]